MGTMVAVIAVGMVLGGYFMFRTSREEKRGPAGERFSPGSSGSPGREKNGKDFERMAERDDGTKQPLPTETLSGDLCEMDTPVGAWSKFKATDEDELGDLFLRGHDLKEKDVSATILVVVLGQTGGDLTAATKMVRDRLEMQKKAENKDYQLVPVSDRQASEPERVGNRRGRIVELKLQSGVEPRKYILLAVVKEAHAIYAIRFECNWEHRQVWQSEFRDLLKSFRLMMRNQSQMNTD